MTGGAPADEAKTVLVVGAGRQQARSIRRARQLGLRVVAVDGDRNAPGLAEADVGEHVDFKDVDGVVAAARRHRVDGVLTIAADQAVPVVAAVAAELGLPGIGTETAHVMTNKIAMRRRLDAAGVPQPRFAEARSVGEAASVLRAVGVPAVVKPADSSGQRGLSLVGSPAELDGRLEAALGRSTAGEAIVERFHAGSELNHLVVARDGRCELVAQSDRVRPQGAGFGVAVTHVFPSTLPDEFRERAGQVAVDAVRALGLRDGIGYPQILVTGDGEPLVMEVAARIPGGQMADLVRYGLGVELVDVALGQALGEPVADDALRPREHRALAILFLTAEPGPLPAGTVRSVGGLEEVRSAAGVLEAEAFLDEGDVVRPVQRDADRHGYVIASGATTVAALARAEAAAALLDVEVE